MKRRLIALFTAMALIPLASRAATLPFTNVTGQITSPPVIDAYNVLNSGTWNIRTAPLPYDMSNVRNFTNAGTMRGVVGFRFDTAPSGAGTRKPMANFHNRGQALIYAGEVIADNWPTGSRWFAPTWLIISATNIVNEGTLSIGAGGALEVTGTNVNLARSGLQVRSILPLGSENGTNYFSPDSGIYDNYWAQTNMTFNSSTILQYYRGNYYVISPPHTVTLPEGFWGTTQIGLLNPVFACFTNDVAGIDLFITNRSGRPEGPIFIPTNVVRQAVFVGISDPTNMSVRIRFTPSEEGTNPMQTVSVELSTILSNVVSATPELNTLYFVDTLASSTNLGLRANILTRFTYRPANYVLSRIEPVEFTIGQPGNAPLLTNILYDRSYTNSVVEGRYAAYSAYIDNLAAQLEDVEGGTITNMPGRITITADSLNLERTRLRGEGLISVQARHLVSSSNTVVDAQNLSYFLGSTNGLLRVQNLAKESVARLQGDLYAWSAYWTNSAIHIITSNYTCTETPDGLVCTNTPLTNYVMVNTHVLLLDGVYLSTMVPVTVHDFVTRSTNVVVNDSFTVTKSLFIDGRSLTLQGNMTLDGMLQNWGGQQAPNLRYFTNNGYLYIPNEAHFGDDTAAPYSAFVNRGTIDSFSQLVKGDYVEVSGVNRASGTLLLDTRTGKVEGGRLVSGTDMRLSGQVLKLNRASIVAGYRLDLFVTNSLADTGSTASNSISCGDGFQLAVKPETGDLLGTTVTSVSPMYALVEHEWAGADRGATAAGFTNNVAIGKLVLIAQGWDAAFGFSGTGQANGLYVDLLDLSQVPDYQSALWIDPNLTIYYADVAGADPEALDGQLGGRLRWVSSFAGPNSSVDVLIYGQTVRVNRALRFSRTIDSDGDGIPNYYDPAPFDVVLKVRASVTNLPQPAVVLSWPAEPGKVYQILGSTNLVGGNWQPLMKFTNSAPIVGPVSVVVETNLTQTSRRAYRVYMEP